MNGVNSNKYFDNVLYRYFDKVSEPHTTENQSSIHNIYYLNQYSPAYEADGRILNQIIIKKNTEYINPNDKTPTSDIL